MKQCLLSEQKKLKLKCELFTKETFLFCAELVNELFNQIYTSISFFFFYHFPVILFKMVTTVLFCISKRIQPGRVLM